MGSFAAYPGILCLDDLYHVQLIVAGCAERDCSVVKDRLDHGSSQWRRLGDQGCMETWNIFSSR